MSRLTLAIWVAALCAAGYPTWEIWQPYPGQLIACGSRYQDESLWAVAVEPYLLPLRGDVHTLVTLGLTWGMPAVIVLLTFGRWHSASAARWAASLLTLTAASVVLAAPYFDPALCDYVPLFSHEWFGEVAGHLGERAVLALLTAAVLVLVATRTGAEPSAGPVIAPAGRTARRSAAILTDYWVAVLLATLASWVWRGSTESIRDGLLSRLDLSLVLVEPALLLGPLAAVVYVLSRRMLWMGVRRWRRRL